MDRQLQKVTDPSGLEITKGTKVTDDEFEGYVVNISDADIDYSDEAQRAVMYCPKITVNVTQDKEGTVFARLSRETYDTHWNEEGELDFGKMMVYICDDLEVVE
jgi:hypothetical protein